MNNIIDIDPESSLGVRIISLKHNVPLIIADAKVWMFYEWFYDYKIGGLNGRNN